MEENKNPEQALSKGEPEDPETIDADQLLAVNQESAKKEKEARQALLHKQKVEEEDSGIEFEATTVVKNVRELLRESSGEETQEISSNAVSKKAQDKKALELEKQILALLAPFFKSKNPKVVAQVSKIKDLLAKYCGRRS